MKLKRGVLFFIINLALSWILGDYGTGLAMDKLIQSGDKLTFGMNIRLRYEHLENFNMKSYGENPAKGESNDGFLLNRMQAGFDYYPTENIHMALWVQNSKSFDLAFEDNDFFNSQFDRVHSPYDDYWEPYNTYLEIKQLFSQPLGIKVGRQKIAYGDNRVFGPGNWSNTGKWMWDAAKLSYKFKCGFVDAYYGKTKIHDPDDLSITHNHGFESLGFYSRFELPERFLKVAFEPFFMTQENPHDRYTGEDGFLGELDSYYGGIRVFKHDLKGFDFDLTYVRQDGDYSRDDIDAYGYHLLGGYRFKQHGFKPRLSAEYTYASGDSDPNDGQHETFEGAFGSRAKPYGRMCLFHWKNLKDAQINLEVKPKKWLYFKAEYHQFWLAEEKDAWYLNPRAYRDRTGSSGDKVGREFDLVVRLKLPKGNELQAGYGHFWPDEFAEKLASDKEANWVFLQWMFKFRSSPLKGP
ncbi:MAG: alginate export family protein [Deltaproteobacteria bacterium]|nr:alginate export family protein [Deltaproteobacteria bacterium]